MSYFGAAFGTAVGMIVGLIVYRNAWRFNSFFPREYDFIHEWGNKFVKTDNKTYTYTTQLLSKTFFHPFIYVFIWGENGILGITSYDSDILSAVVLLLVETLSFSLAIWFDIINVGPKEIKHKIIILQFLIHLLIGILMGIFYNLA